MHGTDLGDILSALFSFRASASVPLICAVATALIYAYKGKPWVGGAFLGFFLGPFGVFIALVSGGWPRGHRRVYVPQPLPRMRTYTEPTPRPKVEYRLPGRCPHCNGPIHRQQIQSGTVKCFYCGAQVEATPLQVA
ncbi:MAG: hypothetical protein E3J25_00135 [Anaerolineales bacterium]|nr:MAG: hypothetical protein E3J25_00135 [Anaerolineales bacterium]